MAFNQLCRPLREETALLNRCAGGRDGGGTALSSLVGWMVCCDGLDSRDIGSRHVCEPHFCFLCCVKNSFCATRLKG